MLPRVSTLSMLPKTSETESQEPLVKLEVPSPSLPLNNSKTKSLHSKEEVDSKDLPADSRNLVDSRVLLTNSDQEVVSKTSSLDSLVLLTSSSQTEVLIKSRSSELCSEDKKKRIYSFKVEPNPTFVISA